MGGNGLSISGGSADIEFTDGTDTYGFKFQQDSWLTETRGSAYVGQISSGGSTYQDAEPWKRKVYDNFLGGMGQANDNKVYGGTGIGGDDTKYFYGDCKTDRAGYLLPGPARNMVYNTVGAAQMTPISDGADPVVGDEYEVPRGVLPLKIGATKNVVATNFVAVAATITKVRLLVFQFDVASSQISASLDKNWFGLPTNYGTYSISPTATDALNTTGWKWVTLPLATGTGTTQSFATTITITAISNLTVGGYIGANNVLTPYFQLMTSATPFKYWANPLVKMEQLTDGAGSYINVAITSNALFNTTATAIAASAGTSPERLLGGTYSGSIVFNSTLFVSSLSTNQTQAWSYTNASTNLGPNASDVNVVMFSPVEVGGKVVFADGTRKVLQRWTGNMPATGADAPVTIVNSVIGHPNNLINKVFVYQGNIWVMKPEGLFQLYADPVLIDTQPGNSPRIVPVVTDLPSVHQDTGKWLCIHQGMIYFNYRDRVFQVLPNVSGPPQVTVLALPMPWYRLSYYHYVNGITSDGVNLYVSYNNLGVFQYTNQVWHPVTEFYEQVATEGQGSGLRWLPNPTGAPDSLFVGDGRTIIQLPVPNAAAPYTSQIYQNHQNKCGYLITSATDMEQAEIVKYVHAVVLRAVPSGFSYKVVAVAYQSGDNVSFKSLLTRTWAEGLTRDNWVAPTIFSLLSYPAGVATTQMTSNGTPVTNTLAPTCWSSTDFNNLFYSAEKQATTTTTTSTVTTPATTDVLTNPPKFVKTAFILYWWNPTAGQQATSNVGTDLMVVDSLVVKYQAVQDYLAQYQCVIDFHGKVSGSSATALTTQQIEDSYDWLRSQTGRHSPLKATFKVRKTGTTTKSILFLPQNPNWLIDASTANQPDGTTPGDPRIKTVGLQMISVQSEYPNV